MKIETLEDWNDALTGCAGCCPMPACPLPSAEVVECGIEISNDYRGLVPDIYLDCYKWGRHVQQYDRTYHYAGVEWGNRRTVESAMSVTATWTAGAADENGNCPDATVEYSGTLVSTDKTWHGNPGWLEVQADLSVTWAGASSWGTGTRRLRVWNSSGTLLSDVTQNWSAGFPVLGYGTLSEADGQHVKTSHTEHNEDATTVEDEAYSRTWSEPLGFSIRWTVPEEHAGSWFLIVWDEMFTPEDEEAPVILTERSAEWNAPDDKVLPWQAPAPRPGNTAGCLEPANVRFRCYRSTAGGKPQIHYGFPTYP